MEEAVLEEAEFYNVAGGAPRGTFASYLIGMSIYNWFCRYGEGAERKNPQQRQQFWEV